MATYLTSATAERVGADLREAVFGRLLGLGLPFHDRHRSGDLVTRLTGDVARVEDSMVAWFTVLVPEVLTLAGMVVVVLAVDLTLVLLAEAMPADAAEEDRLWPIWATGRLGAWQASTMARPPLASRPA